ncbi:MAG TPA: hypothetical protein DEH11_03795 [Actinobacteria bacterium]|nr:hypothetical protein [Actinomycetota bacterium]
MIIVRAHCSRWAAGLVAAVAAGVTGCGSVADNGGSGAGTAAPSATAAIPTTSAPATASPTATASPATADALCQNAQLKITMIRGGVAAGNVSGLIGFTNKGISPCKLTAWPTLVAVSAAGTTTTAVRTLTTTFGPYITAPPTVTVPPGAQAEAVLAGSDVPVTGAACPPSYRRLRVTPPGGTHAAVISAWLPGLYAYLPACSMIRVSPVVPSSALP